MIRYMKQYWNDVDRVLDQVPNLERIDGYSVLITGGSGMICSSVVDMLLRYNIKNQGVVKIILAGRNRERIINRFAGFQDGLDYDFIYYDATDGQPPNVHADYIIHGASNANPLIYTKEPVETILSNVVGLNALLSLAVCQNSKRLLYISSSEVYGIIQDDRNYAEDDYGFVDILNPRACYPSSKRTAETLCVSYGQEYDLDTVIVRPGHIYGPTITEADNRASAQFTRSAANGENIVMKSKGMQLRSYCYTLDCASAILTVLLNGDKGQAYNISNRESVVTISQLAEVLANVAHQKVVYENSTALEKKGYNFMLNSSLNAEKLEKLGWKAIFDINDGIKSTLAFYK